MKSIKNQLSEAESYSGTIMQSIVDILSSHDIKHTINRDMTEIEIDNESKNSISDIIKSDINIKWCLFNMLVEISEIDSIVYIRQKIK